MPYERLVLGLWIVAVVSCATVTAKPVQGPDGTPHILIECKKSQARCIEEAGRQCPNGYNVADSGGYSGTAIVPYGSTFVGAPVYRGTLLIKCR